MHIIGTVQTFGPISWRHYRQSAFQNACYCCVCDRHHVRVWELKLYFYPSSAGGAKKKKQKKKKKNALAVQRNAFFFLGRHENTLHMYHVPGIWFHKPRKLGAHHTIAPVEGPSNVHFSTKVKLHRNWKFLSIQRANKKCKGKKKRPPPALSSSSVFLR